MQRLSNSRGGLVTDLWTYRQLVIVLIKREVIGRYRGSVMGIGWSLFNPILMLAVYTFVFSVVFKSRWNTGTEDGKLSFALVLFAGMIVFALFSECINRAPNLIITNVNYVKKVVFPLEILPVVAMGAALFHCIISLLVLFAAMALVQHELPWTVIFTPLVFMPLIALTLGASWALASLGVYLRDIGQSIGIITTVMMFLSPMFYPLSALPKQFHTLMLLNPLTFIMEQLREIVIWGHLPDWKGLLIYSVISVVCAYTGYFWFQRTRKGFADVL